MAGTYQQNVFFELEKRNDFSIDAMWFSAFGTATYQSFQTLASRFDCRRRIYNKFKYG